MDECSLNWFDIQTMIYPEYFPEERAQEHAERKVFDRLKELSDRYDIFYSKRFVTDGVEKKAEFEAYLKDVEAGKGETLYDPRKMITSGPGFKPIERLK